MPLRLRWTTTPTRSVAYVLQLQTAEIPHTLAGLRELSQEDIRRLAETLESPPGPEQIEEAATAAGKPFSLSAVQEKELQQHLELRSRPLMQQWNARGPGMWKALTHLLPIPTDAERTVHLVYPVRGGGGMVIPQHNSVCMEAVLTDNLPNLPEVVRLLWLLAQAGLSKGESSLLGLATLPPVLEAAESVEFARLDPLTTAAACNAWMPKEHVGQPDQHVAQTLLAWWNECRDHNWENACSELEQRLRS